MKMPKRRILFLDFLRVFSFFLIIAYHFMVELEIRGCYTFQNVIRYSNANSHIATLGVALFFMISGAGMMYSHGEGIDLRQYFITRIKRILIPFWLVYAGYLIYRAATSGGFAFFEGIPKWRILFTVLGMDEFLNMMGFKTFTLSVGEWFLGCIIILYILFPVLRYFMKRWRWATITAFTLLYIYIVFDYHYTVPVHLNLFVKLYEFVLGMFFMEISEKINRKWVAFAACPVILCFLFLRREMPFPNGLKITLFAAAVYLLAMQCEPLFQKAGVLQKFLLYISRYTYELFLVHHLVIYFFGAKVSGRLFSRRPVCILAAVEACLMILLAWILKKISERVTK